MISMGKIPSDRRYNYADYSTWDDEFRCELIEGEVYLSESSLHKFPYIVGVLYLNLFNFTKERDYKVVLAPCYVNLDGVDDCSYDENLYVQPDLFVVCDKSKLDGKACIGAPDLVIEILSPSTARIDMLKKFHAYQKAGVLEYWIVDPEGKTIDVFKLENGEYVGSEYIKDAVVKSHILEGCEIKLADVFEE